jgi:tetratricopeptide (TPR) repeat protein
MAKAVICHIVLIWLHGIVCGCASVSVEEYDFPMLYQPLKSCSPGEIAGLSVPESIDSLSALLEEEPRNLGLLERRGWALARSGAYETGIADLDLAIRMAEESSQAAIQARLLCRRGIVLREIRRLPGAIDSYTAAIEIDAKNWEFYFHRWQALRQAGRNDEAEADRQVGLKLNPEVFEARYSSVGGVI